MTHPGQPTESERLLSRFDPETRKKFQELYEQLLAPFLAGAHDPFQARRAGTLALLDDARQNGFVPRPGTPAGGIWIPGLAAEQGAAAKAARPARTPYGTVWRELPPKRKAVLGVAVSLLFAAVWLLLTVPRGEAAQNAGKPGSRSRLAVSGGAAHTVSPAATATAQLTATTTISTTNPAYPAPDVPFTQSLSPQIGPASLLTPVSLELDRRSAPPNSQPPIYRVVASTPGKDGSWKPVIPDGRAAWLAGTVVNQVFCLPAATLPAAQAGDTILVRTRSGAPLRYTIEAVRDDVGWQQTEVLSQRRNGVTVLGCGGPDTAPRHVWFASFRLEDQPETPADAPVPATAPTAAAPPPLEMVALAGQLVAATPQPGMGGTLMITLQVINHSPQPVPLDPHALTVLDGSTGAALPLVEGLPAVIPPSKDRQTILATFKPPQSALAVLETDQHFGDRRWQLRPQPVSHH